MTYRSSPSFERNPLPSANLHEQLAGCPPKLSRGQVWCRTCGRTESVKASNCLRSGWPKCCGYTMTIDAPEESE